MSERGSVKIWILGFLVASGVGLGGLVGIGCAIGANACPFGESSPEPTTGREVFVANCALCHGVDGAGTRQNPAAPSLVAPPSSERTMAALMAAIESGSPGRMPRFEGKLTDEQIRMVAEYVVELREEGS